MLKVGAVLLLLIASTHTSPQISDFKHIKELVTQWAPLIWMSPDENHYPASVDDFLQNVHLADQNGKLIMLSINETHFPQINTKSLFLVTTHNLDGLRKSSSSFLNGHNPKIHSVPTYVVITPCTPNISFRSSDANTIQNDMRTLYRKTEPKLFFSVTYWTFYPYNQGKKICFIGVSADAKQ
jgi:hypothetical protein